MYVSVKTDTNLGTEGKLLSLVNRQWTSLEYVAAALSRLSSATGISIVVFCGIELLAISPTGFAFTCVLLDWLLAKDKEPNVIHCLRVFAYK